MKKYYVEFEFVNSQEPYSIQSRWFDTKEQAINWYRWSFDLVLEDEIGVWLMSSEFVDGEYTNIEFEGNITAKVNLRNDMIDKGNF